MRQFLEQTDIKVEHVDNGITFDITLLSIKEVLMRKYELQTITQILC